MEVKYLQGEATDDRIPSTGAGARTGTPPHVVATVWTARTAPAQLRVAGGDAGRRFRRRKATRCRSCEFCHPSGGVGAIRACAHPEHAGAIVIGDQMACGSFRLVAQEETQAIAVQSPPLDAGRATSRTATSVCGDCRYHMPHATDPRNECTCSVSPFYEHEVFAGQPGCGGFAAWPCGSSAPLFLSAMRR
jgi:hypothetical protein